jgi:ABC-2 type transport system ATP-binding protein
MVAIQTRSLVHEYATHFWSRPKQALRGLDLAVEKGEIFGYLGANGAGKTTTIKILVGLLRPRSGEAALFDVPVRDLESRRSVGFAPENPYFYEYLTARESLRFYAALCDVPRAERAKRADELLEFVGLREAADVRLKEYSKGMRQRLGIAQAIVHRPRLAILDEPQSGLDPVGRLQVREAILRLKQDGTTVFFSTHILSDVEMICDLVGLVVKGKLEACGPVSSLLQTQVKGVEVGAEGLPPVFVETLGRDAVSAVAATAAAPGTATRAPGHLFAFATEDQAAAAVKAILAAGGRLTLYRPLRETLEEYFMRTTGQARADIGGWSSNADR